MARVCVDASFHPFECIPSHSRAKIDFLPCKERIRLARDYNATVRIYSDLVRELLDVMELDLKVEVDLVHRACKTALENAQRARQQLINHEAEHHC